MAKNMAGEIPLSRRLIDKGKRHLRTGIALTLGLGIPSGLAAIGTEPAAARPTTVAASSMQPEVFRMGPNYVGPPTSLFITGRRIGPHETQYRSGRVTVTTTRERNGQLDATIQEKNGPVQQAEIPSGDAAKFEPDKATIVVALNPANGPSRVWGIGPGVGKEGPVRSA